MVEGAGQWRFALQVLGAYVLSALAFLGAIQTKIWGLIADSPSLPVELALREAFFQALVVFLIATPTLGLFLVLVSLRLSNRFVGPVPRLKNGLRKLADGERGRPLVFRPGDALCGVDAEFNRLAERIRLLEEQAPGQADSSATDSSKPVAEGLLQ